MEHDEHIINQLERTNKLIQQLENQRYLQIIDRPYRFLTMSFLQGIAVALGSTVGLAIVITVVAYLLRRLQVFAPLSDQLSQIIQALNSIAKK